MFFLMERSTVTHTHRGAPARIFEEIGVTSQRGNLFHQTAERLLEASEMVGLRHHQQIILAQPKSEVMVQFPVQMDDGRHRLFKGYRVQHSNALGPFLGGVRFAPHMSIDTVKGHAMIATMRTSIVRVPFGGAFGGVKVNPRELSKGELMRLTRRYCSAISHQLGPAYDIISPDAGADSQVMAWFLDTLAQTTPEPSRQDQSRTVMGKPAELGGFGPRGRLLATGVIAVLDELIGELLSDQAADLSTMRVSLVGFGHAGAATAKALAARGALVTAILASGCALYEPSGIDVTALAHHSARTGGIDGFESATTVLERDFWDAPSELVVMCSGDSTLDAARAQACRARVVVEVGGANITAEAEEILVRQGIEVVPDILAGAASDVASALEWREIRHEPTFRKEDIDAHIKRQMTLAARRVRVARMRYECDLRTAAMCASLERIGKIYDLRGVFP
ncbi:MAG: Glu/Leu/Phe/Val dehydrogenase [Planctomycetota bacterium]|nr:MAG: Glu/Leu/Phe/Val dehydrogenase [Planctomycetota bacterium]